MPILCGRSQIDELSRSGYRNVSFYDSDRTAIVVTADYHRQKHFVVVDPCRRAILEQIPINNYSPGWQSTGWR